jgi:hypothetical protein
VALGRPARAGFRYAGTGWIERANASAERHDITADLGAEG